MEKAFAYVCAAPDAAPRLLKRYCRKIYELGYVPICPKLSDSQYLQMENADEKREFQNISRQKLCRCRMLVVSKPIPLRWNSACRQHSSGRKSRHRKKRTNKPEIGKIKKGDDPIYKNPTREQVELIRQQYPVGTRIILNHMDDSQAPPPGTKGTVAYVDDMGQIGVKWDTGSSLSLIPGVDSFSKEPAPEKAKHKRSSSLER